MFGARSCDWDLQVVKQLRTWSGSYLRACQYLLKSIQASRLFLICIFDEANANIASVVASLASDRLSLLTSVLRFTITIDNATDCPLVAKLR